MSPTRLSSARANPLAVGALDRRCPAAVSSATNRSRPRYRRRLSRSEPHPAHRSRRTRWLMPASIPRARSRCGSSHRSGRGSDYRVRWPAGAHCDAAAAGHRPLRVDGRPRVRGRQRRVWPVAWPGFDAACDLLRLSRGRAVGCDRRRTWVRGARRDDGPGAVAVVPLKRAAAVGDRRRSWRGRRGRTRGRARRAGSAFSSFLRVRAARGRALRWLAYLLVAAGAAATVGGYLVLVLLACGVLELAWQRRAAAALS